jgi:6-phosphogluconolactonase (cycloisomerase 2 family)
LPISITVHGDVLYVLNAGGVENITGFSIASSGALTQLAGSSRPLSGTGVGPAQVGFDPSGRYLVVTEKNTNLIDVYPVGSDGYAGTAVVNPSAGQTPFGFAFNQHGVLIVSEAFGGAVDASAVSSYTLGGNGSLSVVSASVPTTETAACWVAVTNNGKFAYAANTGSASVTGYEVRKATLAILDASGKTGNTGTTPIDAAVSRNSQFLYTLTAGSHAISAFAVRQNDGSLTPATGAGGLPVGTVGLAAR